MAKPKKAEKKASDITPFWQSTWSDIDRSIENFRRDMEKAFSSISSFNVPQIRIPHMPATPQATYDLIDEGNQFRVKMDVPGVKKQDININVTDNSLDVSAKHKEESEEKRKNYLRKERSNVSYYRTLSLPEAVVSDKAKAKLSEGVLEVVLPKVKPTPSKKKKSVTVQ